MELSNQFVQELFEQAAAIGMSKTKLRKRLMQSRSLLTDQMRKNFTVKGVMFDFEMRRLWSDDMSMYLQWENRGETSVGSVYLRLASISWPRTDDDGNAEDDFLYAYDHPTSDDVRDGDEHIHDEGNCCECNSPYHCCCECPVFRNGDITGLTEVDIAWLKENEVV